MRRIQPIRITIEGGELFERNALASEIAALLESIDIGHVGLAGMVCVDDDERRDHLTNARVRGVTIDRRDRDRP
jgi:hypothetical protein